MFGFFKLNHRCEKGLITRENFVNKLKSLFPDLIISDEDILYLIASDFSLYLLTKYNENNLDDLQKGLNFIDQLLLYGDDYIRELGIIGILEGIQNIGSHSKVNFTNFEKMLLPQSKKAWDELNDFWGKIPANPN